MPERGRCLARDRQLCLGQWQWSRRGWRQPKEIQRERKVSRRTRESNQGTWLGGARKGSLLLCYAGPLAEKQKSGISGNRRKSKPFPGRGAVREVRRGGRNVVVWSPTLFGLGRNGCWPSQGCQLPRALSFIFSPCCPLNDHTRVAGRFFKIGRLSSLFSCSSLVRLLLLIFLLLLMSGNVHPNSDPIYPC